jgi:hypothetical protein
MTDVTQLNGIRAKTSQADHVASVRKQLNQLCASLTEAMADGHTITFGIHNENNEFKLVALEVATKKSVL